MKNLLLFLTPSFKVSKSNNFRQAEYFPNKIYIILVLVHLKAPHMGSFLKITFRILTIPLDFKR